MKKIVMMIMMSTIFLVAGEVSSDTKVVELKVVERGDSGRPSVFMMPRPKNVENNSTDSNSTEK